MRTPSFLARNGWDAWHLAGGLAMLVAGLAATYEAWADILRLATEEATHVFLVPVVCAWLIWRRRARVRQCRPVGTYVGPILVAAGWLISYVGYNNAIQSFWHGGSLLVVGGCVVAILGIELIWRFLPAFAGLIFLVQVPAIAANRLKIPLQSYAAAATHTVLEILGAAVERSGEVLSMNGVDVSVAEAGNGLWMFSALALVSYAFAFGTPLRWYVRVLILAISPLLAIVCDVFRLVPAVWLHGNGSADVAEAFCLLTGWGMLIVVFLLLSGIIRLMRWAQVPAAPPALAYD